MGIKKEEHQKIQEQNSDSDYLYYICDICKSSMFAIHCKIKCANCGYTRDCSDS